MKRKFRQSKRSRRSCPTGKVRYRSETEAEGTLKWIEGNIEGTFKPKRAYECPKCNGWHLTSWGKERA